MNTYGVHTDVSQMGHDNPAPILVVLRRSHNNSPVRTLDQAEDSTADLSRP